jgi:caa(3)-type oxidase subunit IV
MSENHELHDGGQHGEGHDAGHHVNYKKIYFVLLALLVVSVAGPFLEILWVTLITAFGIAVVKANLVIQNFMHLKWERRLMKWMLATSLLLMALMFAGIAADVMNHEGRNWENVAAMAAVERGIEDPHAEDEAEEVEVVVEAGFNVESMYNVVCATCHGQAGDGTGAAGAALDPPPANFTDPAFWESRDMDRILNVITNGAVAVGGSPLMVGWSASFSSEQIQEFADYVAEFRPEQ